MAERRGITRWIRLLLDREGAKRTERESQESLKRGTDPRAAERNVGRVRRALGGLRGVAIRLAGALAAVFAVRSIIRFGRESVAASEALAASQRTLQRTLENAGVAWAGVEREVRATSRALWDTHRLTDGEVFDSLQRLVTITGDYERSLASVGLVADVAAGLEMDRGRAAQYVGRVLNGETTVLRRYGIEIEEGADAVAVLTERFNGMAAEAMTGGEAARKAWGDLQEAIGAVLTTSAGGESTFDSITESIRKLTDGITDNAAEIGYWVGGFVRGTMAVARTAWGLVRVLFDAGWAIKNGLEAITVGVVAGITHMVDGVIAGLNVVVRAANRIPGVAIPEIDRLTDRVDALRRQSQRAGRDFMAVGDSMKSNLDGIVGAWAAVGASAGEAEEAQTRALAAATGSGSGGSAADLAERITLLTRANDLRILEAGEILEAVRLEDALAARLAAGNLTLEERIRLQGQLNDLSGITERFRIEPELAGAELALPEMTITGPVVGTDAALAELDGLRYHALDVLEQIHAGAEEAGRRMADAWHGGFEQMFRDLDNLGEGFDAVWRGFADGMLAALADVATAKAAENLALMVEQTARGIGQAAVGNLPGAGAHFSSAAQHGAAAVAWSAFGGAVSAQSRGGAGAAQGAGRPDAGLQTAERAERSGPEVHVYVDGIDPDNPRHQSLTHQAIRAAGERHGGTGTVTYHSRGGVR